MNQIKDPANKNYDFGLNFNYALWTAETRLTLANVKWNNDYRDIVRFANQAGLDSYIDGMGSANTQIENASYAKANVPVRVNIPFNKAVRFNYLRATNPLQPVAGGDTKKSFYYFITDVRYIAPNTTELVVQLDVWQTFGYGVKITQAYIEQSHAGIANSKGFDNFGRDYLTIPEGLDTGGEYRIIYQTQRDFMADWNILVSSGYDLLADQGTTLEPTPVGASGGYLNGLPAGASYYVFQNGASLNAFLETIKTKTWVGQAISSLKIIPNITRYVPGFTFAPVGTPTLAPSQVPRKVAIDMLEDWRNDSIIQAAIPAEYRHLKKFFTYPYMAIEITTFTGMPIIAKPESWQSKNATLIERVSMVPPNERVSFSPHSYNAISEAPSGSNPIDYDRGEGVDFATAMNNFPSLAILNNMASAYLSSNAHSIAFQNRSADWSQQKALQGASTSYDQASSGMDLANRLGVTGRNADIAQTQLSNSTMAQQAMLGAISGSAGGVASGMVGGPAGAAMGGLSGASSGMAGIIGSQFSQSANTESLAIRNSAGSSNMRDTQGNAGYMRDTNRSLAEFAARGDYANTIAGIQAKIQDSVLTQPTTSGQLGGETINLINNDAVIALRWKFLDLAHVRAIGDYWLRYGYAVNQFGAIPDDLRAMTKFTYWKLAETYLEAANMPESFKQVIRGIFEKGVTVWVNPNDIGNIAITDNTPLNGITL